MGVQHVCAPMGAAMLQCVSPLGFCLTLAAKHDQSLFLEYILIHRSMHVE